MKKGTLIQQLFTIIIVLILINVLGSYAYHRFDLTQDKRYTLSETTKDIISRVDSPVIIDVLLEGDFPAEFKKLQLEVRQLLEEFASYNRNIKFSFVNPLEDENQADQVIAQLGNLGLKPANITVEEGGKVSQEIVFPWAMANLGDNTVRVPLLKNKLGTSSEQRVNNSIQQLEYAFADALTKLTIREKKSVAVIKGNGELSDIYITDFIRSLQEYYNVAPFTLDSVAGNPQGTLDAIKNYDLAIVAKPTEAFSDEEKYIMDQYVMNGGKSMWLIDQVAIELDSLYNERGRSLAFPIDLNLNDMFFKYGLRINPVLVNDLYFTQIVLAQGEGNESQYNPVPWVYNPMVFSANDHPINNNIEALRFQFSNAIDTLSVKGVKKSVLLTSSPLSKTVGTPSEISLDIITKAPDQESYKDGFKPLAVLLEGNFTSVFKNRVKPAKLSGVKDDGENSKMIVIADGDLIKNQIRQGQPLELGYDKWTNSFYGNKEFLMNSVNYLLDDNGLINIRSKEVSIPFLDQKKVVAQKSTWQLLNTGLPLLILGLFAWGFNFIRKKKFRA
ncbi:gliding motility-associated ABC transporter substrate-binding protein GldG [Leptobacterium flavescens]|uniref:Gliding motility-associated ABC transporter substrate-binding protein GldG n=1 Tax=Leptobacterium flavescens TaxID=472055 RepID=A0A6P0UGR2_9FLAO|nr:gliding motility-associated ABC transporter substrate-binding protein GldG [Leptobacterium flavescens]NER11822.1 gliding motility-associated ABC transporter substrate-binding protein GldG [Leptobacterium flavescens]